MLSYNCLLERIHFFTGDSMTSNNKTIKDTCRYDAPSIPVTAPGLVRKPIVHEEPKKMAEMEDRWLSVDEIGKYPGVSSDTVYRWIEKHTMPAHRMGRLWKFKKDQVDAWVEAGDAADRNKNGSD